jgi:hypothetical protein
MELHDGLAAGRAAAGILRTIDIVGNTERGGITCQSDWIVPKYLVTDRAAVDEEEEPLSSCTSSMSPGLRGRMEYVQSRRWLPSLFSIREIPSLIDALQLVRHVILG